MNKLNKMTKPVFVIETPNFMGMPTEEGEDRMQTLEGERQLDIQFARLYVHGSLQHDLGYDIVNFCSGHITDDDDQECVMVNDEFDQCAARLVSIKHNGKRYGLIVANLPDEVNNAYAYIRSRIAQAKGKRVSF